MANTSKAHKEKKSQKRKDRQLRREQKKLEKKKFKYDEFIDEKKSSLKGSEKSLPGFLAKNVDAICSWLNDYFILFQKADDANIDYMKNMDREIRNKLVQNYIDMHTFIDIVNFIKTSPSIKAEEKNEDKKNEEIPL